MLERLVLATVNEQRAARRWSYLLAPALDGLVWRSDLVLWQRRATTAVSGPHTAVVEIKGEIASGADASAGILNAAMRSALEDSSSRRWSC